MKMAPYHKGTGKSAVNLHLGSLAEWLVRDTTDISNFLAKELDIWMIFEDVTFDENMHSIYFRSIYHCGDSVLIHLSCCREILKNFKNFLSEVILVWITHTDIASMKKPKKRTSLNNLVSLLMLCYGIPSVSVWCYSKLSTKSETGYFSPDIANSSSVAQYS